MLTGSVFNQLSLRHGEKDKFYNLSYCKSFYLSISTSQGLGPGATVNSILAARATALNAPPAISINPGKGFPANDYYMSKNTSLLSYFVCACDTYLFLEL